MKIAILGTRGIPNRYGGFEQSAHELAIRFSRSGHAVTVYNPADHPYRGAELDGVKIRRIASNERRLRFLNSFLFDYLCLRDARRRDFDFILELGYHPASLFYGRRRPGATPIVTNMAGMEWQRSKWNGPTRRLIRQCERLAVRNSHALISDNEGIRQYYLGTYGASSFSIAYGAELFSDPDQSVVRRLGLAEYGYDLLVARFQRDNNIEMILEGHLRSETDVPIVLVGDSLNAYGLRVRRRFSGYANARFVGGIYDYRALSSLRWFSRLYLHGHACGGTNPSLLEAMASNAHIVAHDNPFNRSVLLDGGAFFRDAQELSSRIVSYVEQDRQKHVAQNRERVATNYTWDGVAAEYLSAFDSLTNGRNL